MRGMPRIARTSEHQRVHSGAGRTRPRLVAATTFCAALLHAQPLPAQPAAASPSFENVQIRVPDGTVLGGRYRDAGPGAPGVLLFPMCSSTGADGWRPIAERLQMAGVSSLMVDEPGYGPDGARNARADAAFAFLRSRLSARAELALTGGSCGVALALGTASRHPNLVRALVVLSGPYGDAELEYVRRTPGLAVFSGASAAEPPTPEGAQALKQASANPASRVEIWTDSAHGTDYFAVSPSFAEGVTAWLVERLRAPSSR